jgi:hypothetical protein
MGISKSHNPMNLHGLLQGLALPLPVCYKRHALIYYMKREAYVNKPIISFSVLDEIAETGNRSRILRKCD